jgi:hypothetical protein
VAGSPWPGSRGLVAGLRNSAGTSSEQIAEMHALLVEQRSIKEWYSTSEVAEIVGKAEFTVREWCRHGRIRGEKRACGRGSSGEWVVSHEELTRYRNEGLRPLGKH